MILTLLPFPVSQGRLKLDKEHWHVAERSAVTQCPRRFLDQGKYSTAIVADLVAID
jgi:hypothetical protein